MSSRSNTATKVDARASDAPLDGAPVITIPGGRLQRRGRSARVYATLVLMLTDLAAMFLCYAIVALVFTRGPISEFWAMFRSLLPIAPLLMIGATLAGLHPGFALAPGQELRRYTITSLIVNGFGLAAWIFLHKAPLASLLVFLCGWLLSIPILTLSRVLVRAAASHAKVWGVPVVVFGSGKTARSLIDRLLRCRWIGYRPELLLDTESHHSSSYGGIPVVSDLQKGFDLARRCGYSTALVALPSNGNGKNNEIIQKYVKAFPTFILFPDFAGLAGVLTSVRDFEGILGLSTRQRLQLPLYRGFKRIIDVVGVLVGGLVFLPFILVIMALVKMDSPGPVFYGHRRIGQGGREFRAWKFRSMIADADQKLAECFEKDPEYRKEWNAKRKIVHDPRVTRFGRFLRRRSLDELPQLWNILKGEMSLVGPRPIVRQEIPLYGTAWEKVSSVVPGLTGYWQVSGRSETGFHERIVHDLYYIQNWSIWLDLFIIFKTIWTILLGTGAC
jgi:Undecaprenyl-phosphate galactose phosphotransferase WbaP